MKRRRDELGGGAEPSKSESELHGFSTQKRKGLSMMTKGAVGGLQLEAACAGG